MSAKQKKNAVTGQGRGLGKYIQHNWQLWVMLFPAMLFPAMVETYAILALLVSFLAVNGIPVEEIARRL